MHNVWVVLLAALALLWVITAVRVFNGMANLPRLLRVDPLPNAECPSVSILVAARDEGNALPECLATLLALDYPGYEVIVVNDRSSDATPQILEQFARHNKNLRILNVNELPKSWLGKSYAMFTAYEHATGDWLVFTDADVRFAPDLLRRALGLARSKQWDHLSVLFFMDLVGFWEKTAIGWWVLSNIMWLEPWRVSDRNLTDIPAQARFNSCGARPTKK